MSALATLVQAAPRTPANVADVPIDPALAKRVRAVAQAAEKKRQERDELILAAHAAGASLREIGDLVGLSHVGVMKIVKRDNQQGSDSLLITSIEGTDNIPLAALADAAEEIADREDRDR